MAKKIVVLDKPDTRLPFSLELLGQSIKHVRTASKLSIEDAAALSGVSKQAFSDVEHGKDGCRLSTVIKITASLGIKLHIDLPLIYKDDDEAWEEWQRK